MTNMDSTFFSSVFTGFLGGIVGVVSTVYSTNRNIRIKNITVERAKWRELMRSLASDLIRAAQNDGPNQRKLMVCICSQLEVRLNPFDEEDRALLSSAKALVPTGAKLDGDGLKSQINEFSTRMALLLKHDWERAKYEASFWSIGWFKKRRVGYYEYISGDKLFENNFQYFMENKDALVKCMVGMLIFGALLFVFSSVLVGQFKDLFIYLVGNFNKATVPQWADSIGLSISAGLLWLPTYLFFKTSENNFLEIWSLRPVRR